MSSKTVANHNEQATQSGGFFVGCGTGASRLASQGKAAAELGSHSSRKPSLCHSERAKRVELFRPRSQTALRTV